jgi:hypothetical protein
MKVRRNAIMKKESNPKGHHYVPESYLKRFTDNAGFLYIRDLARQQVRRQRPIKVMKIDRYYRQAWAPTGINPDIFEVEIGKSLESEARGIINRLIMSPGTLNNHDTASLSVYMELQRIRVPRQAEAAKELMRSVILNSLPPDIAGDLAIGRYRLTIKDSARFEYMRMAVGTIHPWLARMEWEIFEAEDGSAFVTTDSPVSFFNERIMPPYEAGVGLAGTIVLFPLSSRKLLLMRHPECRSESPLTVLLPSEVVDGVIPISSGTIWGRKLVELTNSRMAHLAHELVVGESADALNMFDLDWIKQPREA